MTDELQKKIVWQNINSSKEKGKILTGKIIAIENEQMKEELITCAIIDFNGIRVLIPATEISEDSKNDKKLLRNMMGAEIKFIIVEADRISEKAIGSRKKAMERLKEINIKKVQVGDKIYGKIVPRKYGTKHEIRHTGHRAYSYPYEDNVKTCVCGNSVGTGTGNFYWSDLGDQEGKSVGSRLYVLSH